MRNSSRRRLTVAFLTNVRLPTKLGRQRAGGDAEQRARPIRCCGDTRGAPTAGPWPRFGHLRAAAFRNLTVKNRIFRSNVAGPVRQLRRLGHQARINWELKFARGGVGAIISSFVPVDVRGRIVPNYATSTATTRIPFWRELGDAVHEHDCRYIMQLAPRRPAARHPRHRVAERAGARPAARSRSTGSRATR